MTGTNDIRQERQPVTAVWRNGGFSASYDTFVVNQKIVLRLKFSAQKRHLRKATKRWQHAEKDNPQS